MSVKNISTFHIWDLANVSGGPYTGLVGTMTTTLVRFSDESTQAAASETVTAAEIGSTGYYSFEYTPANAQLYRLHVIESVNGFEYTAENLVTDAADASVADNAYCSEADVAAWTQLATDFTASTKPTEAQVLTFMETRAAELYSHMTQILGSATPGPAGSTNYTTEIDTTTDKGFALGRLLKMANAVGAAMDTLAASGAGESPGRSERITEFATMYQSLMPGILVAALNYRGYTGRIRTHITSGEITKPSTTAREHTGLAFSDISEW